MKEEIVEALETAENNRKQKELKRKGSVLSVVSIFSSLYGMIFWSSLFLPVGLFLSLLGITVSINMKNKVGVFLGVVGLVLSIIGLYYNPIWLTHWYSVKI